MRVIGTWGLCVESCFEQLVGSDDLECVICIEQVQVGDECITLPCAHQMHEGCGLRWLEKQARCPLCKMTLGGSESSSDA